MNGLWIQSLKLSHFRSHVRAELEVDARPVAIHGANGAGKTNLLEAISLLSPGRGLRRAGLGEIARRPEGVGWRVAALLQSQGQFQEVETRAETGQSRTVLVNEKTQPQNALAKLLRVVWLIPAMDRLWLEGADGRRRFLDRMTLSFEPSHAEAALTYEKAMRERNRLLKDIVRDAHWYAALEQQMAQNGAKIIQNRALAISRLSQAMEDGNSAFPKADLSIEGPEGAPMIASEADLLTELANSRPLDLRAGRSLVGPHRDDLKAVYAAKNLEAKSCSTGEQKALLLSLILANARALAEDFGAPPILLLDEVAAHLDQSRRAELYDEICELKAQAWMTGTGAELFVELGDRSQHFEVREEAGISEICRV